MKIRKTLIAFLLALLVALPMKIYQLLKLVDYSTGYFRVESFVNILLPVLLGISIIVFYVMALTSKSCPQFSPNVKSASMGIVSGITALAIGWMSAADLLDAENAAFEGTIGLVYSCLGLICVLAFLFPAVSFFMGHNLVESRPVIMILPVLWMGMRMVLTFFDFTTKASISESIYDLVMMVFMLLFLLSAAKFLSGASGNSAKMVFASGCSAALLAATANIPRYILFISDADFRAQLSTSAVHAAYRPQFADFMLMTFAVGLMLYISVPVRQELPLRSAVPHQRSAAPKSAQPQQPYQNPQQRNPYSQPGMMGRPPYMPQRRPVQRPPLPGAGPDMYTTRGAGMRVAEDFNAVGAIGASESKYGGLDTFRENMLSGRRALEVLESSVIIDRSGEEEVITPTFTVGDIAEVTETPEKSSELDELTEEITESLSSLFAMRDNANLAPKEAVIDGASDEPAPAEIPVRVPQMAEPEYPPVPPARRSVSLGTGRHEGRLADRLSELEDRRSRRVPRAPEGRMPYGEYEEDYDEGYGLPRGEFYRQSHGYGYDEYEEEYDGYGYDETDDYDEYDDDDGYYDDVEYGASEYYEYDDDDDYDDGYDEYDEYEDDDEYDEYDDYGDSDDYDYDDEGYGAPRGGYNYW